MFQHWPLPPPDHHRISEGLESHEFAYTRFTDQTFAVPLASIVGKAEASALKRVEALSSSNQPEEHVVTTPRARLHRRITIGVGALALLAPAILADPAIASSTAVAPTTSSTSTSSTSTTTTSSTTTTTPAPGGGSSNHLAAASGRLAPGSVLPSGSQVTSPGGTYWLAMQTDGNLVFYKRGATGKPATATWASGTSGSGATHLVMETNGDLALLTKSNATIWTSHTSPATGVSLGISDLGFFSLITPGNIVLWFNGTSTGRSESQITTNQTLTAGQSLVASNGDSLSMQTDGNLVVYGSHGAIWASGTAGSHASILVVQTDGNVVVYAGVGHAVWAAGTNNLPVSTALITTSGQFTITGPEGPLWHNGTNIVQMPKTVGVYAYPNPQSTAISQGWPILGVTGALGTCGGSYTGLGYSRGGNDEQTGFAIQNSTKNIPWLSFWTVSGPTRVVNGQCVTAGDTSPKAFYKVGFAAGRYVAKAIDSYAADGLRIKPSDVILDPEGLPDNHSFLDQGINNPSGPTGGQIYRWTQMLSGWSNGIHSIDSSLTPAVYADQAEYSEYNLATSPLPAFLAVAFGYAPGSPYPVVNPVRLPGVNGLNIRGVIAFFAGVPDSVACRDVRFEARALASWGAPLNTLQFDPGTTCQP